MVPAGGQHILVDYWGIEHSKLVNEKEISSILEDAARLAGATVLSSHFHHFGGDYGVTGVVILAESHISIHTWPESNYCALDIFMCGNSNPSIALDYIEEYLKPTMENIHIKTRGQINE